MRKSKENICISHGFFFSNLIWKWKILIISWEKQLVSKNKYIGTHGFVYVPEIFHWGKIFLQIFATLYESPLWKHKIEIRRKRILVGF